MSQKNNRKNKKAKNSSQEIEKTESTSSDNVIQSTMATVDGEKDTKSSNEEILLRLESKLEQVNKKIDEGIKLQEFNYENICEKLKVQEEKSRKSQKEIDQLSKSLKDAVIKQKSQARHFKELEDKIEQLEREKRKKTILIEGVKETPENSPENIIIDLFRDIEVERGIGDIDAFFRRGKIPEANANVSARPRPIVITFIRLSDKVLLFRNLHKLKNNMSWKNIYVNDDLTEKQMSEVRDLKAVNALARSQGANSFMKGNQLNLNGQKYNQQNIDKLPENFTMERAKNRMVDGDKGLAFQGHHSVLSNMAECDLVFNGNVFTSSEAALQHEKAKICGSKKDINDTLSAGAYKAKAIGKNIKDSKEWDSKKLEIIYKVTLEKFKQNDDMLTKLMATGNLRLYEATPSKYWGCGLSMSRLNEIGEGKIPGANKFGQILEKVRNDLKQ